MGSNTTEEVVGDEYSRLTSPVAVNFTSGISCALDCRRYLQSLLALRTPSEEAFHGVEALVEPAVKLAVEVEVAVSAGERL